MGKRPISEWAAIAEIIGTAAVVVSLVFLVFSIRQNTNAIQAANEDFLYDLNDRWYSDQVNNPEIYENWDKMLAGEALSPAASGQLRDQILRGFNVWENFYVKYRMEMISESQYRNWHESNARWAKRRIPKFIWDDIGGAHWRLDFEDQIDAIYAEE